LIWHGFRGVLGAQCVLVGRVPFEVVGSAQIAVLLAIWQ
jgi:hypothetical protein